MPIEIVIHKLAVIKTLGVSRCKKFAGVEVLEERIEVTSVPELVETSRHLRTRIQDRCITRWERVRYRWGKGMKPPTVAACGQERAQSLAVRLLRDNVQNLSHPVAWLGWFSI